MVMLMALIAVDAVGADSVDGIVVIADAVIGIDGADIDVVAVDVDNAIGDGHHSTAAIAC